MIGGTNVLAEMVRWSPDITSGNIITLVTLLGALVSLYFKLRERVVVLEVAGKGLVDLKEKIDAAKFDEIRTKLDVLWSYNIRRGEVEAINEGLAARRSPLSIQGSKREEEVRTAFNGAIPKEELIRLYRSRPEYREMLDAQLAEIIESALGERLVLICEKLSINFGACLALAIALMREDKPPGGTTEV